MLRLRRLILVHLLPSPSTTPSSSVHRLLYATAPRIVPSPRFDVEEYLVDTCGLTRAQALKASVKLSHLKSPANADAVLNFLAGLGLSSTDVAAVVAKHPRFLCARVEATLTPNVSGLTGLGLSSSEVARLVSVAPYRFRVAAIVSQMCYYLPIFGSYHNFLQALKFNTALLTSSFERVVNPNIAFLRECGLGVCDIAKLSIAASWMLTNNPKRVRATVACAEGLGVPRGSPMFRHAVHVVSFDTKETVAAKLEYLKKTFRWSDAELSIAVSRAPYVLAKSKESLQRRSEFLISEVGLEPTYLAHRPVIVNLSLEGRLKPRFYVVKFLKQNKLLDHDWSYATIFKCTEKVFLENFIYPHKEAAPHLAEDYEAACRGQVPTRFIFS